MSERTLIIFCGLLMALSAFSVDITLPLFSTISRDLSAPMPAVQATVTVYIFAIGLGQLIFGPASDRYGRRPTLAAGLLVYLVGAGLTLLAQNIEGVLAGRLLQGLGGSAGAVVARAMIRDRSSGRALAKNMALASAIFSAGPIFAPLIGIAIAEWIGHWRAVFFVLLIVGALLMLALLAAPETLARKQPAALAPATLYANAATILSHRQSRYFMLLSALGMAQMVSILASAPRVYETEFGVTGRLFAILFAMHGIGIIIGQFLNHRLIGRLGVTGAALAATGILIASSAAMALFALIGFLSLYGLTAFLLCFAIGFLAMMANFSALVLDPHGAIAGFTTSFMGCFAQFFGAVGATFVAILTAGRIVPLALFLLAVAVINAAALVHWRATTPPANR